jgi:hypothetical protein
MPTPVPPSESDYGVINNIRTTIAGAGTWVEQTYLYADYVGSPLPPGCEIDGRPHVRINVLGPIGIDPWVMEPTRNKVIELACYLGLHRRRTLSMEELQMALSSEGSDGPETTAKTVRTYMSELRRSLGTDHVPTARGSGYGLADSVACDWDVFKALTGPRANNVDKELWQDDHLWAHAEALNLINGQPFAGTNYRWVDTELLVSEMEVAIGAAARHLGGLAREHGFSDMLWYAGHKGATACPYDLGLWAMALEGAADWDPDELAKTWHDVQVTLGDEVAGLADLTKRLGLT